MRCYAGSVYVQIPSMYRSNPRQLSWLTQIMRAPNQQHELDHTDHTDHTDQGSIFPERSRSWTVVGTYHTDHTDHGMGVSGKDMPVTPDSYPSVMRYVKRVAVFGCTSRRAFQFRRKGYLTRYLVSTMYSMQYALCTVCSTGWFKLNDGKLFTG